MSNELVNNPFAQWDDGNDASIPTATLQIYQYIAESLARKEVDTNVNRASAASMCYKRRWFQRNGFVGTPLSPRKIVNFALGDLTEHMVKYFILKGCVGPGKLYSAVDFGKVIGSFPIQNGNCIDIYEQEDLTAQIGDYEVTCHVDGWGRRNSDGKFELIEVKSAADYGFESFKENGPGDYLKQAHVNMRNTKALELGVQSCRFFYLRKSTGHVYDRLFDFEQKIFDQVTREFQLSNYHREPERPYEPVDETFRGKPTGRKVLPFPCSYCSFATENCHPTAVLEFKSGRPKFVVPQ